MLSLIIFCILFRDNHNYKYVLRVCKSIFHIDVEKRFNISFLKQREQRADFQGPENGIDPLANSFLSGKGLLPETREVDCRPNVQ